MKVAVVAWILVHSIFTVGLKLVAHNVQDLIANLYAIKIAKQREMENHLPCFIFSIWRNKDVSYFKKANKVS